MVHSRPTEKLSCDTPIVLRQSTTSPLIAQQLLEISKMDRQRTSELMLSTISAGWAMPQVISRQLAAGEGLDQETESHCSESLSPSRYQR